MATTYSIAAYPKEIALRDGTVEGCQTGAAEAARAIGFVAAGRIDGGARDTDGHLHDVTILSMPLGKYYEWSKY